MNMNSLLKQIVCLLVILTNCVNGGIVGLTFGFVPIVGPIAEIGCGFATGNPIDVATGTAGLALDVFTWGASRAATNTARAVRMGQKGAQLRKAANLAKTVKEAEQAYDLVSTTRTIRSTVNSIRKGKISWC